MTRNSTPASLMFGDDGKTPNNTRWPLLHYRDAVSLEKADPASTFEKLFATNGWGRSWRNGIYPFLHFHTQSHEVLGIVRGSARVQFGGAAGEALTLAAGDVIVLPAGTGHQRLSASADLLVVGAYPAEGKYDQPEPQDVNLEEARKRIAEVPRPQADPIHGADGPLRGIWKA